jgi:hypothetical protein
MSCGLVNGYNVSDDFAASIFKVHWGRKFLRMLETIYQNTRHHIAEDRNVDSHREKNRRAHKSKIN